jgi:hypothetical protein
MLSPKDIQVTKLDVTLAATFLVVQNIIVGVLMKTEMFTNQDLLMGLATIIGFALNGLLVSKLSDMVNRQLNVQSVGMQKSIYDLFRFSTVFISQRALGAYFQGQPIDLTDTTWLMTSGLTIGGYALFYNFVESNMPSVGQHQPLANDLVRVSMGSLLASVVVTGTVTQSDLIKLGGQLAGFVAFHMVTKNLVA